MTDYFDQTLVLLAGLWPKLVAGFLITLELAAAATPLALVFGLLLLAPRMDARASVRAPAIAFMLQHGEAKALIVDREFSKRAKDALELCPTQPLVIDYDDPEYGRSGERIGAH